MGEGTRRRHYAMRLRPYRPRAAPTTRILLLLGCLCAVLCDDETTRAQAQLESGKAEFRGELRSAEMELRLELREAGPHTANAEFEAAP